MWWYDASHACVAYFIWMQRNRLVHDACSCNPKDVMQRTAKLICDFWEASAVSFPSKSAIITTELSKVWSPPDGNVYKVNWEVVVDSSHLHWWVGILIRDAEGVVLAASCEKLNLGRDIDPWDCWCYCHVEFCFWRGLFWYCVWRNPISFHQSTVSKIRWKHNTGYLGHGYLGFNAEV